MAESEKKPKRLRLPRKRMVVIAGGAVLFLTASAAAAFFIGGMHSVLGGRSTEAYGLDCTLIDNVGFDQGDHEHWVRQYIAVDGSDGMARVLTGLRVARAAAAAGHADLVLVVVADKNGPKERGLLRDSAVGARIVYAPHPARVDGVKALYSVRYRKGAATVSGAFYGDTVTLTPARIDTLVARMKKPYGCKDPVAEKAADAAGAKKAHH